MQASESRTQKGFGPKFGCRTSRRRFTAPLVGASGVPLPLHPQGNPIYHPTLVGDDFFLQSGAAVSINLALPTGR
jgi:hypothetical protein